MGLMRLCWLLLMSMPFCVGAEVETIPLTAKGEILRAEVFVWGVSKVARLRGEATDRWGQPSLPGCRGVLVLCPGQNGSSEGMLRDKVWQEFAERQGLALAGFHFVSSDEDLKNGRGYFAASRGSGALLEEGLKKAGLGSAPLVLYGFSGGAHFAMSFAAWRPERVAGFCAYSFAWWSPPPPKLQCPALIVCGQADGTRYGASLAYFQAGRRQASPWAWVSLKETPHAASAELDEFVRAYFSCVMNFTEGNKGKEGLTGSPLPSLSSVQSSSVGGMIRVDNVTEKVVEGRKKDDVSTSVLPCLDLLPKWQAIHHP